jgi:transcriptional regulator with XRE-family HTH domain
MDVQIKSRRGIMIGKRLKLLREEMGLKQIDIAEMLGVSRTTYTQYETEKSEPDLATVAKLAEIYNTSVDFILGKTDIKTPIETIAAHRSDDPMSELPEEARKSLEEFKQFILKKYSKGKE